MSIYDKSSLVLIPSGTKTGKVYSQKPTNGDGDFTFTRSSAATRVNADGNIEKETGNLLLQSNNFNTTWNKIAGASFTSGQAGYDGTNDAWQFDVTTASNSGTWQSITFSGVATFSAYFKKGTIDKIGFTNFAGSPYECWFDLTNGTIGQQIGDLIDAKIVSVGGGWYRCSITDIASGANYFQLKPSNAYSGSSTAGNIYIQDAQLEQSLVARDYIETTTSAVYGGITDNVPRLDYTDSSCPALLLEPLRTNLITQSEYTGGYGNFGSTDTANEATSPEGVVNATLIEGDGSYSQIYTSTPNISVPSSGDYTLSIFAKKGTNNYFRLFIDGFAGSSNSGAYFDLLNGSTPTSGASIKDYGNGWYKCSITATIVSGDLVGKLAFNVTPNTSTVFYGSSANADGKNLYVYGAQLEAGSYPTSYIPTYGSSVSRVQDEADAFNAGDLITDNEGVLFVEFDFAKQDVSQTICLNSNNPSNRIGFWTPAAADLYIFAASGGTSQFSTDTGFNLVDGETYKVAVKWTNNIVTAFANGSLIFTSSTITNPVNLSVASINNSTTTFWDSPVKQYMVFPTALTDQEAIDLTTI